jgi:hypothetical protein
MEYFVLHGKDGNWTEEGTGNGQMKKEEFLIKLKNV